MRWGIDWYINLENRRVGFGWNTTQLSGISGLKNSFTRKLIKHRKMLSSDLSNRISSQFRIIWTWGHHLDLVVAIWLDKIGSFRFQFQIAGCYYVHGCYYVMATWLHHEKLSIKNQPASFGWYQTLLRLDLWAYDYDLVWTTNISCIFRVRCKQTWYLSNRFLYVVPAGQLVWTFSPLAAEIIIFFF